MARIAYNAGVTKREAPFPRFVDSQGGYQFRLDRPFKNKTGTYTVMVQMPSGGRLPVRDRNRSQAIEDATRRGHEFIADKIARGWLSGTGEPTS